MKELTKRIIKELEIKNTKKIKEKIVEIKKEEPKIIKLTILGEPLQTQRPRTTKFGKFYVPNAAKNKKAIRKQIKEQMDLNNFDIIQGEVHITMRFYVSLPKNFPKNDKVLAEMGYIRPTITPDVDNFMKTYMDALTGVVWLDDGQVTEGRVKKYYSIEPRVEIEIKYFNTIHSHILRTYAKNKMKNYMIES